VGGNNARLLDLSESVLAQHYQQGDELYQQLRAINASKLGQADQINLSVLSYNH
jgi:hypothetical protein